MSRCIPQLLAAGADSMTSMIEAKLVSGTVDHCQLHLAAHSGTDCTGTGGSFWGSVSVEASWRTRRPGFISVGSGLRSLHLRLSCTGEDAVVRFDDLVVTALSVNLR